MLCSVDCYICFFPQQAFSFVCKYAVGAGRELIVDDDSVCILQILSRVNHHWIMAAVVRITWCMGVFFWMKNVLGEMQKTDERSQMDWADKQRIQVCTAEVCWPSMSSNNKTQGSGLSWFVDHNLGFVWSGLLKYCFLFWINLIVRSSVLTNESNVNWKQCFKS